MDELNELEAQMAEDELNDVEIGAGAVEYGQGQKQPPQKHAKAQSEEDELKALEASMMWCLFVRFLCQNISSYVILI